MCVCVGGGGGELQRFSSVFMNNLIGRCVFPVFICFQWIMHLLYIRETYKHQHMRNSVIIASANNERVRRPNAMHMHSLARAVAARLRLKHLVLWIHLNDLRVCEVHWPKYFFKKYANTAKCLHHPSKLKESVQIERK